jgi:hypothetical protein
VCVGVWGDEGEGGEGRCGRGARWKKITHLRKLAPKSAPLRRASLKRLSKSPASSSKGAPSARLYADAQRRSPPSKRHFKRTQNLVKSADVELCTMLREAK